MRSPFSTVFCATSLSCTALRFAILARWRSADLSSIDWVMMLLYSERNSRDEKNNMARPQRKLLIEPPCGITKLSRQRVVGDNSKPDFIGDKHDMPIGFHQCNLKALELHCEIGLR